MRQNFRPLRYITAISIRCQIEPRTGTQEIYIIRSPNSSIHQCSVSSGGLGSLPGAIVSLLRILTVTAHGRQFSATLILQHLLCCVESLLLRRMKTACSAGAIPPILPTTTRATRYSSIIILTQFALQHRLKSSSFKTLPNPSNSWCVTCAVSRSRGGGDSYLYSTISNANSRCQSSG